MNDYSSISIADETDISSNKTFSYLFAYSQREEIPTRGRNRKSVFQVCASESAITKTSASTIWASAFWHFPLNILLISLFCHGWWEWIRISYQQAVHLKYKEKRARRHAKVLNCHDFQYPWSLLEGPALTLVEISLWINCPAFATTCLMDRLETHLSGDLLEICCLIWWVKIDSVRK